MDGKLERGATSRNCSSVSASSKASSSSSAPAGSPPPTDACGDEGRAASSHSGSGSGSITTISLSRLRWPPSAVRHRLTEGSRPVQSPHQDSPRESVDGYRAGAFGPLKMGRRGGEKPRAAREQRISSCFSLKKIENLKNCKKINFQLNQCPALGSVYVCIYIVKRGCNVILPPFLHFFFHTGDKRVQLYRLI